MLCGLPVEEMAKHFDMTWTPLEICVWAKIVTKVQTQNI